MRSMRSHARPIRVVALTLTSLACRNTATNAQTAPPLTPFRAVGDWLKVNGDAIYGTRP
jgi:hypothetical protein